MERIPRNNGVEGLQIDPSDELYLHHTDQPSYVLSTQLLNDTNYNQWKRSVEVSLAAKNKLNFVTGKCKTPSDDYSRYLQWKRCNNMVISWLLHSVEKDIAKTLLYCNTPCEIWRDLQHRFGHLNSIRTYQVQKELFSLRQGARSVKDYFASHKKLWDEYLSLTQVYGCAECDSRDNQQTMQFLVGLNDSYGLARANILMKWPIPSIGQVLQIVLKEEKQIGILNIPAVADDFVSPNLISKQGNRSNASSAGVSTGRPNYFCDHCKVQGHTIDRCFKLHGYPPPLTLKQCQQFFGLISKMNAEKTQANDTKASMLADTCTLLRRMSTTVEIDKVPRRANVPPRTIVLMGRTGNGKSATGNTILGTNAFKSRTSSAGVTSTTERQTTTLKHGQVVNVIDTPGLFDFSVGPELISKEIIKCISLARDGIHAVLLVFSVRGRFTEEEEATIQTLRSFFGPKIVDYTIVVFTGGDDLEEDESVEDYLGSDCPEPLQKILEICENRSVIFDNKTKDERKKEMQVEKLISLVENVIEKNGGQPYTDNLFAESKEAAMLQQKIEETSDSKGHTEQQLTELTKQIQKSNDRMTYMLF